MQRMVEALHRLSEKQAEGMASAQSAGIGQKGDSTTFSVYKLAALMGWCGIVRESKVPPIWLLLLGSKEVEDHRLNIMKGIKLFCTRMNVE
jgi:hypothetical protein